MIIKPRCEITARYLLPAVRGMITKTLVEEYGFSQSYAAKILGITQAAVSYYVGAKRGQKLTEKILSNKKAMRIIKDAAKKIARSKHPEKVNVNLCDVCRAVNECLK